MTELGISVNEDLLAIDDQCEVGCASLLHLALNFFAEVLLLPLEVENAGHQIDQGHQVIFLFALLDHL